MRTKQIFVGTLGIFLLSLLSISCSKKAATAADATDCDPNAKGTYFSITQFGRDQFSLYRGEPYSFIKTTVTDSKKDTVIENIYNVNWAFIFKTFFESDISNRKFLCHYNFSQFDDDVTKTRNYYYEAKDPGLFTRKLIISTNPESNKVISVYVETEKKTTLTFQSQKLLYQPLKVIQIQKFEKNIGKNPVNEVIQYNFM